MLPARDTVSVIVCTYTLDRWRQLNAAVASLRAQTRPPDEIVLVSDTNHELLARLRDTFPGLHVVANRFAPGLSGARNTGVAAANGSILAFVDDDALAAADWLERLLPHYANPCLQGVGGRIDPIWLQRRPGWFPEEFGWVIGCSYRGQPETVAPVRNLIGCNMSFRRAVFESVGGFRADVGRSANQPMGCEETELCIRLRQAHPDALLLYDPAARVQQWVPRERASFAYFRARCRAEGRSKALVSRAVGAHDALHSERDYSLRVLPRGAVRAARASLTGRDAAGLSRAAAIGAGFALTTCGYVEGRALLRAPLGHAVAPRAFQRVKAALRGRASSAPRAS
jgi:hypothetical protein